MKKILFLFCSSYAHKQWSADLHIGWVKDCDKDFDIRLWGHGYSESCTLLSLKKEIDKFKPDYIYATIKPVYTRLKKIGNWLPDITSIKVPKIFVEVDTFEYDSNDPWYKQFDKLYCRQPIWGRESIKYNTKLGTEEQFNKNLKNLDSWRNVPLFKWSVSSNRIFNGDYDKKSGVYFVGRITSPLYKNRLSMYEKFKNKVIFKPGFTSETLSINDYWENLYKSSALICPTESAYGEIVPAKIFEYSASGSAVITNCDLAGYDMKDLQDVVIKYKTDEELKEIIDNTDFKKYYGITLDIIRHHSHNIRYKEIFV